MELINLFEEEPSLYDTRHEFYLNKHARTKYLKCIALKFYTVRPGTTVAQVKSKWNSLRRHFNSEQLKVTQSKKSGEGTDNIYVPTVCLVVQHHKVFTGIYNTEEISFFNSTNIVSII